MFDGFAEFDIAVSGTTIHGRRGGDGPPLLLLHGTPPSADDHAPYAMRELARDQLEVMPELGCTRFALPG